MFAPYSWLPDARPQDGGEKETWAGGRQEEIYMVWDFLPVYGVSDYDLFKMPYDNCWT